MRDRTAIGHVRMRRAYHADSALAAESERCALGAELDRAHPDAAASLREGMSETPDRAAPGHPAHPGTYPPLDNRRGKHDLDLPHAASNVKIWRDGTMALRWCTAGMLEAGKQFRRFNGHMHLRSRRDTLERVTQPVGATGHPDTVTAAW